MHKVSPNKAGIALGIFLACWHAFWSLLVAIGLAQAIVDFIFWLHFIAPPYRVEAFEFWRALGLVAVTAIAGYAFGAILALIWNYFQEPKK